MLQGDESIKDEAETVFEKIASKLPVRRV